MCSTFNIISDITFARSRETLKCKQKELKSVGKGNKPKAAEELSDMDIDAMYDAKSLGSDNPHSLLHTMWMICCLNFGMRTGKETRNLHLGDIDIRNDDDGSEYLIFISERQTKTRPGDNPKNIGQIKPRAYATPEDLERCPVNAYKLYRQRRPPASCTSDSPFFLAINNNRKEQSYWYKNAPLGVNKLYGIMKAMTEGADIADDKRLTPYSMRKHLVQKLTDSGVSPNDIIQISGHKNVNSINNYSSMNTEKQKGISRILSNSNTANSRGTTADRNPDSAPMPGGFAMQSVSNRLQNQHFLTCLLSGNTINGNVNIRLSPDMFNVSMSSVKNTANATTSNTCEDELPPLKRPCLQ
ncbi:uncharacterized protein KIAA1958-like [Haliotis cracherodii]|uniref:uncharacterized protein KIAA1958-like n=1 Tax=Haliotis cracherodii TaxID=6455 RepID=UPI0039E7E8A4